MKGHGHTYENASEVKAQHDAMKRFYQESPAWVIREGHAERYIVDHVPDRSAAIVDIGASAGLFLRGLKEQGYKNLTAVDIDNYLQEDVKQAFNFVSLDLNFGNFPYADKTVDVVTCLSVLEHLENPFHFAWEVHRVLKDDGLFILSIPNGFHIWSKLSFLLHGDLTDWRDDNAHITFLTKAVFRKSYLRLFNIERVVYQAGFMPYFPKWKTPRNEFFGRRVCYFFRKRPFARSSSNFS